MKKAVKKKKPAPAGMSIKDMKKELKLVDKEIDNLSAYADKLSLKIADAEKDEDEWSRN